MSELTGILNMQYLATRDPDDGKAYLEEIRVLEYDFDDTGEDLIIRIPASTADPVYLVEVLHLVRTAFNGTTPLIDVGDGTTADKYIADTTITEATAGNLARSVGGAKLTANAQVKVTVTETDTTAGAGTLFVRLFRPA